MAATVASLVQVKLPAGPAPPTPEQRYWRSFRSHQQIPSPASAAITHVSFPSPADHPSSTRSTNDLFAVTSGLRVQLYSIRARKLLKSITRFDDVARSGEIRADARVLLAGDDSGTIQVFDVHSRAILRTWKEHKQPVWATKFSPHQLTTVLSASDDKTVKLWDLPRQESTTTLVGHGDYVRAAAFLPATTSGAVVSASYDESVRIWDPRVPGRAVMTFMHRAPVESVLPLRSGTTVLAAAGNQVSVLDLVAAKPQQVLQVHQKTVTSLCLASNGSRVLSGGLDGHLKVLETTAWTVVAGFKYPSPILSLRVISAAPTHEDKHLVVGLQSGILSIRTRFSGEERARDQERAQQMAALMDGRLEEYDRKKAKRIPLGVQKRRRGRDFAGAGIDVVVEDVDDRRKGKKLPQWEVDLRKGRYAAALDGVLNKMYPPVTVLTLLTALRHRSALRTALLGRDERALQPIVKWLTKHLPDPRYLVVAVEVGLLVVELYAGHLGESPDFDKAVRALHARVREEVERAQQACLTEGMLDLILSADETMAAS
ncbi:MAG: hypothetical protein M1826_000137 [Phylliscum demangeonii]|nr:MAG: hypothetical protein M1826_000137 [Phylliscum demangeonii]